MRPNELWICLDTEPWLPGLCPWLSTASVVLVVGPFEEDEEGILTTSGNKVDARASHFVFCENSNTFIYRLVPHICQCPEDRVCGLFVNLQAESLVSHGVLWDYSPQIRNLLFPDPQIQTRSKPSKKIRLPTQCY